MNHTIEVFELDVPSCTLEYGVTCSAQIGVTGEYKCFNSPGSCQVPIEFEPETKTIRWVSNSEAYAAAQINAIPALLSAEVSPQKLKPGESLPKSERCNIALKDHPHNDYGFDPYIDERDYNPFEVGLFLGRFAARWPNPVGYPARYKVGTYTENFPDDLETAHYVVDKVTRAMGGVQFSLKDALTFSDNKKALCPRPSNGILAADISDVAGSLTLDPPGIGDTYASSGYATIGGKEFVSFTRSGDVITLTGRGLRESDQKAHEEGSTFQQAAHLNGNIATILAQILDFTETPQDYYDSDQQAKWQAEAAEFASEILEAFIAAPTGVETLINHLMTEMALNIWTDVYNKKIEMRKIRPQPAVTDYSEDNLKDLMPDTDNDSRIDTVYIHYGRVNPVEKINEFKNYVGHILRVDDDPKQAINQNTPAIKEIYSIFIPSTLRTTASNTANLIVKRNNKLLKMAMGKTTPEFASNLSDVVNLRSIYYQDDRGFVAPSTPMQIISLRKKPGQHEMTFQENTFGNFEPEGGRTVSILVNHLNVNLRELYNATYGTAEIPAGTAVIFEGTGTHAVTDPKMGGSIHLGWSVVDGDWPEIANGVTIEIRNTLILGKGGNGGTSAHPQGYDGSHALYTRTPITLNNVKVGAGGGGGGAANYTSAGGGWRTGQGGAGYLIGVPASIPPGSGGGTGGGWGQPGGSSGGGPGVFYPGGQPGIAVDGYSYLTLIDSEIFGTTVN